MPSALKGTKVQVSCIFRAYHHSLAAEVTKYSYCLEVLVWHRPLDLQQLRGQKFLCQKRGMEMLHNREEIGSHDVNLRSCSDSVECWCPHLLNLFTKLSHYLLCVRISLGWGRIGQMGFRTFLQARNSQDWTDGLQEATFRPWTHEKRKRKGKHTQSQF